MLTQTDLITGADLQELKESFGITLLDLWWVTGVKSFSSPKDKWKLVGERSDLPIPQPSLTILIRYLQKYENESMLLPEMPDFLDFYDKIAPYFDELSLGKPAMGKIGLLLGIGQGAPNEWRKGLKRPSLGVQRMLYVVNKAVEKDGVEGFKRYLGIVEKEAICRDIGNLSDLFSAGTWASEKFKTKYSDPSVPVPEGLLTGAVFNELREQLGLTWWDLIWLMGRATFLSEWKTSGKESFRPHSRPTTCILARYLMEYDEESFIPDLPDHSEVYDLLVKIDAFKKLSGRVVGPLFGVRGWSFNQWRKGLKNPTPMVRHLFFILKDLIEKEGKEGFEKYFAIVKEEVIARDLGDYDEVIKNGWGTRAFMQKYYSKS